MDNLLPLEIVFFFLLVILLLLLFPTISRPRIVEP